tara:strand:- start:5144 stop:5248 length:105 start_codon:yes stop_codon:yes gene_type:complete
LEEKIETTQKGQMELNLEENNDIKSPKKGNKIKR